MIKLVVFDFDGTIADTRRIVEDAIRKSCEAYKYKIDEKFLKYLGDAPIEKFLERIAVKKSDIRKIAKEFTRMKQKNIEKIKKNAGAEFIRKIAIKKIILSNNKAEFIRKVLKNLKLNFFEEIYGAGDFNNKIDMLKKIIKKNKIRNLELIYIGDKVIDVNIAREIGCLSAVISGKACWSSEEELRNANPDFIIKDLREIKEISDKLY